LSDTPPLLFILDVTLEDGLTADLLNSFQYLTMRGGSLFVSVDNWSPQLRGTLQVYKFGEAPKTMPWALTSNALSVPPPRAPFLVVGTISLFLLTLLTSRRDILFTSLENLATSVKTTILKYRLDSFQIKIFISFRQKSGRCGSRRGRRRGRQ
jgi:hypothetical protein